MLYAMWCVARNIKKGLMAYEEQDKVSFQETRQKWSEAKTCGAKLKAINEYYSARRHKGEWTEDTKEGKFWSFLVKDFSTQAWKYCLWLLVRKLMFAAAMGLTLGAANAGAVIILHIFDISVLTFMNPFSDNLFQCSEMFGAVSNLFSMILASMPTLYGEVPEALSDFMLICFALVGTLTAAVAAVVTPIFGIFGAAFGLCMSAMPGGVGGTAMLAGSGTLLAAGESIRASVQELVEDSLEEMAEGIADGDVADVGDDAAVLGLGAAAAGGAAYYAHKRSKALQDGIGTSGDTANATLTLGLEFSAAGEEGSTERQEFQNQLVQDLADASEVEASRFHVKAMSPGSIVVDLDIVPDPTGEGPDSALVVDFLEEQAANPESLLRKGSVTCHTQRICNNGPSVSDADATEQAFYSDVKRRLGKTSLAIENSSTALACVELDAPPKRALPAPPSPSLPITTDSVVIQAASLEMTRKPGNEDRKVPDREETLSRKDKGALAFARRRKLLSVFSRWSQGALSRRRQMEARASMLATRKRRARFFGAWYRGVSIRRMDDLIDAGSVLTRHFDRRLGQRLVADSLRKWAIYALGYSSKARDIRLRAIHYRKLMVFQEAVSKERRATLLKDAMTKWLWKTRGLDADEAGEDMLNLYDDAHLTRLCNGIYVSSPPGHIHMSSPAPQSPSRASSSVFSKRSSRGGSSKSVLTCNDLRVDILEPMIPTGYEPEDAVPAGAHVKAHRANGDLEACCQPSESEESRVSGNSAGNSTESTIMHEGTAANVAENASSSPQQLNGLVSDLIGAALIGPQFLEQKLRYLSRNQSSLSNLVERLEEGGGWLEEGGEGHDYPASLDFRSVSPPRNRRGLARPLGAPGSSGDVSEFV